MSWRFIRMRRHDEITWYLRSLPEICGIRHDVSFEWAVQKASRHEKSNCWTWGQTSQSKQRSSHAVSMNSREEWLRCTPDGLQNSFDLKIRQNEHQTQKISLLPQNHAVWQCNRLTKSVMLDGMVVLVHLIVALQSSEHLALKPSLPFNRCPVRKWKTDVWQDCNTLDGTSLFLSESACLGSLAFSYSINIFHAQELKDTSICVVKSRLSNLPFNTQIVLWCLCASWTHPQPHLLFKWT